VSHRKLCPKAGEANQIRIYPAKSGSGFKFLNVPNAAKYIAKPSARNASVFMTLKMGFPHIKNSWASTCATVRPFMTL